MFPQEICICVCAETQAFPLSFDSQRHTGKGHVKMYVLLYTTQGRLNSENKSSLRCKTDTETCVYPKWYLIVQEGLM